MRLISFNKYIIVIIVIILFSVFILNKFFNLKVTIEEFINNKITSIFFIIQRIPKFQSISKNYKELKKENIALKHKLNNCLINYIKCSINEEEISTLKKALKLKTENYDIEFSYIIGKVEFEGMEYFVISKGKKSGIKSKMPVIDIDKRLIGIIDKVFDDKSYFFPLNSNKIKLSVKVLNRDNSIGILKGSFNLGLEVDKIFKDIPVKKGDIVITYGLEEEIPYGIFVGKILDIKETQSVFFKKLQIDFDVNLDSIKIIGVIKKYYD